MVRITHLKHLLSSLRTSEEGSLVLLLEELVAGLLLIVEIGCILTLSISKRLRLYATSHMLLYIHGKLIMVVRSLSGVLFGVAKLLSLISCFEWIMSYVCLPLGRLILLDPLANRLASR